MSFKLNKRGHSVRISEDAYKYIVEQASKNQRSITVTIDRMVEDDKATRDRR